MGSAIKLLIRFESYGTTLFGLLHQCLSHVPFITFGKWNLMSFRSNLLPGQMTHVTNLIFDIQKNVRFWRILISVLILKNDDRPDKNVPSGTKIDDRSHLDARQITQFRT